MIGVLLNIGILLVLFAGYFVLWARYRSMTAEVADMVAARDAAAAMRAPAAERIADVETALYASLEVIAIIGEVLDDAIDDNAVLVDDILRGLSFDKPTASR